jgi:DnaK suppressor protein
MVRLFLQSRKENVVKKMIRPQGNTEGLTEAQQLLLKEELESLRSELEALLVSTREGVRPVDLEQPIGRLSRLDAMQQQQMAQASRSGLEIRLQQVQAALRNEEYGICKECEEPIGFPRLKARPETPFCRPCQGQLEVRR